MVCFFVTLTGFIHIQMLFCLPHLQFALLIKVEDAFFEVVHLAEDQGLIKHSVVASQQRHSFPLQDFFSLPNTCIREKQMLKMILFFCETKFLQSLYLSYVL